LTLSQIRAGTSASGTQVAQSLMWWTGYGDLTRARDVKNGNQNQCFTYDTVGRLTVAYTTNNTGGCNGSAAAGNGRYHYTYQYEDNGNIDQVTDHLTSTTNQYAYGAGTAGPHAVTSMGSTTYLYDANGNQTNRGSDVLTWDASNRLTTYDPPGAGSTQFIYDADGTRIVRLDSGTATTTIGGVYEHVQGGSNDIERVTYRFAGQTVAVRTIQGTSNTLDWVVTDHLGSTAVTRDATSGATVRQWYNPYGAERANTGGSLPTEETYTGQTSDASTGLMHYNARYYDPSLRRFISADTIIPNPSDPADLNRYTYVHNNPVRYSDPTGHDPDESYLCGGRTHGCTSDTYNPATAEAQARAMCALNVNTCSQLAPLNPPARPADSPNAWPIVGPIIVSTACAASSLGTAGVSGIWCLGAGIGWFLGGSYKVVAGSDSASDKAKGIAGNAAKTLVTMLPGLAGWLAQGSAAASAGAGWIDDLATMTSWYSSSPTWAKLLLGFTLELPGLTLNLAGIGSDDPTYRRAHANTEPYVRQTQTQLSRGATGSQSRGTWHVKAL
jgi:RHS repeat-associated protein